MISSDKLNSIADIPGVIGIIQQGDCCVASGEHEYAGESTAKPTLLAALALRTEVAKFSSVPITVFLESNRVSLRFFNDGADDSRSRIVVACERGHEVNKSIQRVIRRALAVSSLAEASRGH